MNFIRPQLNSLVFCLNKDHGPLSRFKESCLGSHCSEQPS